MQTSKSEVVHFDLIDKSRRIIIKMSIIFLTVTFHNTYLSIFLYINPLMKLTLYMAMIYLCIDISSNDSIAPTTP